MYQNTIAAETTISGTGLHSGIFVNITLKPQPENIGIIFCRVDLPGKPCVQANVTNVVGTERSTSIGCDGWKISTIEHLMAAFHGLGIDNILVEVDGEELPVGDGSAGYFADKIIAIGICAQNAERHYRVLENAVWVEGRVGNSKATIVALPSDKFEISFTFTSDHKVTGTQFYHFELDETNPSAFMEEVATARTVGFLKEIEYLQSKGLALGGDLDCVVVVGDDGYQNELRFPEEIVRHKILDALGDLYLLGPMHAHIVAVRSGHALDFELSKKLFELEK